MCVICHVLLSSRGRVDGHDVCVITHGGWIGRAQGLALLDFTWGTCEWLVKSLLLSNASRITANGFKKSLLLFQDGITASGLMKPLLLSGSDNWESSWRLCFLPSRITGINVEREIYLLLRSGNALPMGMPWILLTGDGGIKIVIQQFIFGPNNEPVSGVFWRLSDINFSYSFSYSLDACSVVVYTSPVYDPGLRVKTHFLL